MRKGIKAGFTGLVFLIFAALLFITGKYERKIVRADEAFVTLDFNAADSLYADLEESVLRFLPASPRFNDRRRETYYWQERYDSFLLDTALTENLLSPEFTFILGNATYRSVEFERNRRKVLSALDEAIEFYESAIKLDNLNFNAAYNYEYLHKVRNNLIRKRISLPIGGKEPQRGNSQTDQGNQSGQGRAQGNTGLHGREGVPSQGGRVIIRIFVPQNKGNERGEPGDKVGKGNVKRRPG